MFQIKNASEFQQIIEKSEFIAIISPVTTTNDFLPILKNIKKKYPKANHYCTAYILDNSQGSNDDGEPSGTAGIPILEMLNAKALKNVYAVVVRYFGGIKLGAGGLIRAYASVTKAAISKLELYKEAISTEIEVSFSYDKINLIDQLFNNYITHKSFLTDVTYHLSFIDDANLVDQNSHLFTKIIKKGTTNILVPWK